MSINLHNIDNLFKQPIEEYSDMPSSAVWDNINQKLDEKKIISLKRKYTNLMRMTAMLIILLVCSVVYYYGIHKPSQQITFTQSTHNNKDLIKEKQPVTQVISGKNVVKYNIKKKDTAKTILSTIKGVNEFINEDKNISSSAMQLKMNKTAVVEEKIKNETDVLEEKIIKLNKNIVASPAKKEIRKQERISKDAYLSGFEVDTLKGLNLFTEKTKERSKKISVELLYKNYHQKILSDISTLKATPAKINPLKFTVFTPLITQGNILRKNRLSPIKKISVTVYASPEIAFNRLDDAKITEVRTGGGNRPPDDRDKIKKGEQRATSFSSGILVDYKMSRQWSIQSGISLTQKLSETAPKTVFAEVANDGVVKFRNNCVFGSSYILPKRGRTIDVGDSAMAETTRNKIFYMGIPVNISYHISKGKFSINPNMGTTLNFLVNQVVNTSITDSSGSEKQQSKIINGLKTTYINAHFGIDFGYMFTNKISITLMPTATMALTAVNKNSSVKSYPNTFGIRAGLKIYL